MSTSSPCIQLRIGTSKRNISREPEILYVLSFLDQQHEYQHIEHTEEVLSPVAPDFISAHSGVGSFTPIYSLQPSLGKQLLTYLSLCEIKIIDYYCPLANICVT